MSFRTRALAHGGVTGSFSRTLHGSDALHLRSRLTAVTPQSRARARTMRILRTGFEGLLGFAFGASPFLALMLFNNWTFETTVRHIAAARNCEAARSVGLAPSLRGQPGYWPWLDANHDGVACETWHTDGRHE